MHIAIFMVSQASHRLTQADEKKLGSILASTTAQHLKIDLKLIILAPYVADPRNESGARVELTPSQVIEDIEGLRQALYAGLSVVDADVTLKHLIEHPQVGPTATWSIEIKES